MPAPSKIASAKNRLGKKNRDFEKLIRLANTYRVIPPEKFLPWLPSTEEARRFFAHWLLDHCNHAFAVHAAGLSGSEKSALLDRLSRLLPAAQVKYMSDRVRNEARELQKQLKTLGTPPADSEPYQQWRRKASREILEFRPPPLGEVDEDFRWHLKQLAPAPRIEPSGIAHVEKGRQKEQRLLGQELFQLSPDSHAPALNHLVFHELGEDIYDPAFSGDDDVGPWSMVRSELYGRSGSLIRSALCRQTTQWARLRGGLLKLLGAMLPRCLSLGIAPPDRLDALPRPEGDKLRAGILPNPEAVRLIESIVPNPPAEADAEARATAEQHQNDFWQIMRELRNNSPLREALLVLCFQNRDAFFRAFRILLKRWADSSGPAASGRRMDKILVTYHQELRQLHGDYRVRAVYAIAGVQPPDDMSELATTDRQIRRQMDKLGLPKDKPALSRSQQEDACRQLLQRIAAARAAKTARSR